VPAVSDERREQLIRVYGHSLLGDVTVGLAEQGLGARLAGKR
jgi:hypothetical protein